MEMRKTFDAEICVLKHLMRSTPNLDH